MKHIYLLSKQNISLAKEEILSLTKTKDYKIFEDLLILDTPLELSTRLGYTHSIYRFLFTSDIQNIKNTINNFAWNNIYSENFRIRVDGLPNHLEKELSSIIWKKLKNPAVNLKNPITKIKFFKRDHNIICGLHEKDIDKSYLKRKPHLRPRLHPTSMDPRLIRAMINLTGKMKGKLLDPFCGSGGILIEAGLIGYKIIGYDIEKKMLKMAKENLDAYGIKKYILKQHDSSSIPNNICDTLVTDLPYGKNSKAKNLEELYKKFLKNKPCDTIIIGFPDFVDHEKILKNTRWNIVYCFNHYLHKSLSKNICVLKHQEKT